MDFFHLDEKGVPFLSNEYTCEISKKYVPLLNNWWTMEPVALKINDSVLEETELIPPCIKKIRNCCIKATLDF